jgi:hypothetical protein
VRLFVVPSFIAPEKISHGASALLQAHETKRHSFFMPASAWLLQKCGAHQ